jgi:tetratricopeptide (TPR) repeat protein
MWGRLLVESNSSQLHFRKAIQLMKVLQVLLAAFALAAGLDANINAAPAPLPSAPNVLHGGAGEPQGDDADQLLRACYSLHQQEKYEAALANCAKAAQLRPKDFRPHAFAGLVYMAQMKFKSASLSLAKAIALESNDKYLYLLKGTADSWRGAKDEALAACRKALELDPNYAEAHALMGEVLRYDEKRQAEAMTAYRSAIKADPRHLPPYAGLGGMLSHAKDEKGAEEVFRQGMAADPQHMAGRFELGRMLVQQGRLAEARELWEGRTSDEDDTFPNFIDLLQRAENMKSATEALAKKPDDPEALLAMGLAVMEGDSWVVDGRQERAIVYFKKALAIRPDFAKAQYAICKAYVQIADTFTNKKTLVDAELVKLRRLDPKLAAEIEEYRKTYFGGLRASPTKLDQ